MITLGRSIAMQVHSMEAKPKHIKGIWEKPDSLGKLQQSESEPNHQRVLGGFAKVGSLGEQWLARQTKAVLDNMRRQLTFPSKEESLIC
jgi:hypothetical protein